jgi:predicted metal-dependent hydrolase
MQFYYRRSTALKKRYKIYYEILDKNYAMLYLRKADSLCGSLSARGEEKLL